MPPPSIASAISAVRARAAQAAPGGWRWMGGYAKVKVASDWIYPQLSERIEPGARVLDLGSGIGLLGLVLEERNQGNTTQGIEWDERKVAFAQRLLRADSPCQVRQGDLLGDPWPPAEVVVLVDVLHYFPESVQKALLARIAAHLPRGGALFLRVTDPEALGRARITRLLERLAVAFRWNRAAQVHWRTLAEIQADLRRCGLEPSLCPAPAHLFDGNRLIAARKP